MVFSVFVCDCYERKTFHIAYFDMWFAHSFLAMNVRMHDVQRELLSLDLYSEAVLVGALFFYLFMRLVCVCVSLAPNTMREHQIKNTFCWHSHSYWATKYIFLSDSFHWHSLTQSLAYFLACLLARSFNSFNGIQLNMEHQTSGCGGVRS